MTELLYFDDSYRVEFEAQVVSAEEGRIVLDRSALYPGGGGQPADRGWIIYQDSRVPVTGARRDQGQYWYQLDGQAPPVGSNVNGEVDWERRYQLMRTHTAMHILCGVIWRDYQVSVTGGNMDPLKGRMDFEFDSMTRELADEIEGKINFEVEAARPVSWRVLPREQAFEIPDLIRTKINLLPEGIEEVRVVEIEGLDLQADGGTHVRNTSEVGTINVVDYKSKGAQNKRLVVELEEHGV